MVSARTAFRGVAGVAVTLVHHSKVLLLGFQLEGLKPGSATHVATWSQILLVYHAYGLRCAAVIAIDASCMLLQLQRFLTTVSLS